MVWPIGASTQTSIAQSERIAQQLQPQTHWNFLRTLMISCEHLCIVLISRTCNLIKFSNNQEKFLEVGLSFHCKKLFNKLPLYSSGSGITSIGSPRIRVLFVVYNTNHLFESSSLKSNSLCMAGRCRTYSLPHEATTSVYCRDHA
jgi:hypothetical protein